ncbi:MAG: helix-turn-helix domain-containing protein [Methylocella sp.]
MSRSERERSHVVRQVIANKVSQRKASEHLGICVRQVKRLVRAYKPQGDAGLVSRQRGRFRRGGLARSGAWRSWSFCAANIRVSARRSRPGSFSSLKGSRFPGKACGGCKWSLACGNRSGARPSAPLDCASGGRVSAN